MDDGKRKERDEGLRSLIDKYNDMVANSLLGPNEKREIVDRCYEMRERFGFVPGSLGDYFIVRIANVLAQDVGLRLNIQDIRRPKSLITCSQFLALSSNFHAAALHFEKEQTENTLKDLLRAARELRKGIVSSEDEVIRGNLTSLGKLSLMLDPGSRYHQALRERVTNNAREQLEQNSYKKDIDELDALYLDEPSPTIATKAKKKKKRKKNGGDRLEVSEAQGSSSTSVVQKREEKQPPIPLLADPVLPVVAAVSSSSENFQVVSYHRPRTEPVEGEGNKKVALNHLTHQC